MLTATKQWFTLPVLISCYCFVCTQANSGSVYLRALKTRPVSQEIWPPRKFGPPGPNFVGKLAPPGHIS